ncbi:hypothetical protein [Flavobacterium hibernum]|uniref:Lipoprotein n=1 Tax=Flavobacterium hibernum TaxID=37752 RepID=A0ABX4CDU6_9FLAO|nr:hypothetical protein [Flavobacterium hibernum]OXA91701.1 hypothetical protein B0A73_00220 [Flavobacterium hibernum]STO09812.1 Uncharacterised protein [Flavobacterium hibernum]
MKKITFLIFISILFYSCKEDKIEFVQSKAIHSLFLIKNPPLNKNDDKLFYRYTFNTEDFLISKRPGGYSRKYLDNYPEDELAAFFISKCKNDTTKLVGRFHFYGLKGLDNDVEQIDTLIYKCN